MAAVSGTATYSGDPSDSPKDEIRFLIPDTESPFLLNDAEIEYAINTFSGPFLAAAYLCEQLSGRFACAVDKKIGSLSISSSQKSDKFRARAEDLKKQFSAGGDVSIFIGGETISGKQTLNADPDAVHPHTEVGQDDNTRNGKPRDNRDSDC